MLYNNKSTVMRWPRCNILIIPSSSLIIFLIPQHDYLQHLPTDMYLPSLIVLTPLAAVSAIPVIAHPTSKPDILQRSSFDVAAVMLAGAAQLAMQVPPDGSVHLASDLRCLNNLDSTSGNTFGSCALPNVDHIAVPRGFTCFFLGQAGWTGFQNGDTDGDGYLLVGPPQRLEQVQCQHN